MPTIITDSKFADLRKKLQELFELDKSDLDFGIYRIMAAKNKEVTEFLDRHLKDTVRRTLEAHGAGATDQVQAELDKAIQQAETLGADPETLPKVKELRARLATAGGASAAELEADIYNHLLAFFSRYYDEGDFISKRRYKGDVYAIPYSGEEVTLYWANKDQYYIKSGEWHKDYRFKIGDKSVRFKLVEATQETNNNKEPDDAKRRYILDAEKPVEVTDAELTLRFQFRLPTEAEKQAAVEAAHIFGGDFAKTNNSKKGDQREQFCADAEQRALAAAMPESWKPQVNMAAATPEKPARTILGKHLDLFTARNTFDYFIHRDLGGFLKRELDFYIKNEVVRLDDLAALPADHLARVQGKVKAIRAVAGRIIDFLASIENFQKKMWLKKKLVLETDWLVTIDRIPAGLRDIVAANAEQWKEWETLGFKPADNEPMLIPEPKWGTRGYLDADEHLVVDTRLFDRQFVAGLLASERAPAGKALVDDAVTGVLIHADNFHALNLLQHRYREQVKCVYIDPPYNTASSAIPYKNDYPHSAWASMIYDRLALLRQTLSRDGAMFVSIDKTERTILQHTMDMVFGAHNRVEELVWSMNTNNSQAPNYSTNHEYVLVYANDRVVAERDTTMFREPKPGYEEVQTLVAELNPTYPSIAEIEARLQRLYEQHRVAFFEEVESQGLEWENEKGNDPWKGLFNYCHAEYRDADGRLVNEDEARDRAASIWIWREADSSMPATKQAASTRDPTHRNYRFYRPLHPVTGKPCPHPKSGWKFAYDDDEDSPDKRSFVALDRDNRIAWGPDEQKVPQLKRMLHEVETNVGKSVFQDYSDGEKQTSAMFGESGLFLAPKHASFVSRFIQHAAKPESYVIDCFGGSGSTAHAVIELNRTERANRKFLLVEAESYFGSVLRPRITKAVYSGKWRAGSPVLRNGISSCIKVLLLESYEDALNNLPAPTGELLANADPTTKDALITYSLDLEMGPNLLSLDIFRDPWGYSINAQPAGEAEIRPHRVDLVETFNYLLGLKVKAYGPIERYEAEFEEAAHPDKDLRRLKVAGRLRRDKDGPFVYQRVEGELLDGTRVLVVWRKLTENAEQDAAVLDAWMDRHREDTKQRSEHREYHLIYINGPVTLPQPTAEVRTVLPIEQTFKDRMFADGGAT